MKTCFGAGLPLSRGYLIVFEGIDGVGKSTHCRFLLDYLTARGIPAVRLYEPTHGPWGVKIRKILEHGRAGVTPREELEWFINDRKENVANNIKPALECKKVVLLDRYYYSTAAYQGALGLDPDMICKENEAFAPRPDLVLLFTVPAEECLARIAASRKQGPNAFEQLDYLKKVQAVFESFDGNHIVRIDSRPEQEVVQSQVRRRVDELFSRI
jgi:dTMP kinase